jgi:hypothetical protein
MGRGSPKTRPISNEVVYALEEQLSSEDEFREFNSFVDKSKAVERLRELVGVDKPDGLIDHQIRLVKEKRTIVVSPFKLTEKREEYANKI